jgi:LPS sulfotransferase NodH
MAAVGSRQAGAGLLPTFLAVGPQRTGTTWLHNVLVGHAGLPKETKETLFFSHTYGCGLEWYESHFRHCDPGLPIGEVGSTYFEYPQAKERIARHIPKCKIICSLRDHVGRSYSYYKFMRRHAYTKFPFEEALVKHKLFVESNRYAHHVKEWFRIFGRDNVLVCLYDDLESDPQAYFNAICDFTGVARVALTESPAASERANAITHAPRSHRMTQNVRHLTSRLTAWRAHRTLDLIARLGIFRFWTSGGKPYLPLAQDVDARLRKNFLPEVEALEDLIGRDLTAWKVAPQGRRRFDPVPARRTPTTQAAPILGTERAD